MTGQDLHKTIGEFVKRVNDLDSPNTFSHSILEVRAAGKRLPWAWANCPGIYAFIQSGAVVYVGRAARDTLSQRVRDQIKDRGHSLWNNVLSDPATCVEVFAFLPEDWRWVPSLEVNLIEKLTPQYNKRRC